MSRSHTGSERCGERTSGSTQSCAIGAEVEITNLAVVTCNAGTGFSHFGGDASAGSAVVNVRAMKTAVRCLVASMACACVCAGTSTMARRVLWVAVILSRRTRVDLNVTQLTTPTRRTSAAEAQNEVRRTAPRSGTEHWRNHRCCHCSCLHCSRPCKSTSTSPPHRCTHCYAGKDCSGTHLALPCNQCGSGLSSPHERTDPQLRRYIVQRWSRTPSRARS